MRKSELVTRLAQHEKLAREDALTIVRFLFDEIGACLMRGEDVHLMPFGVFRVVTRAERQGRNPRTGEPITIPAKKVIRFSPAMTLQQGVEKLQQE